MAQPQNLTTEEMDEAVRVAVRMHEEEAARDGERRAAEKAVEEVGVPAGYLDRAAGEVRAQREALVRRRRRRHMLAALGGATALLAALGLWWAMRLGPAPGGPPSYTFDNPAAAYWQLDTTPGSDARVTFANGRGADVTVDRFQTYPGDEHYRVDLSTMQTPPDLTRYRTVRLRLRGSGLGQIRVFLENANERWCSPFLTASGDWHIQEIPLDGFLRQTRPSDRYNWTDAPPVRPTHVGRVTLKFGAHANPETARGEVQIGELDFR